DRHERMVDGDLDGCGVVQFEGDARLPAQGSGHGVGFELRHGELAANLIGPLQRPGDGEGAAGGGIHGLLRASEQRGEARVGEVREIHLRVERIVSRKLKVSRAAYVRAAEVGRKVENYVLPASGRSDGEIAERLVVDREAARMNVGIEVRDERSG